MILKNRERRWHLPVTEWRVSNSRLFVYSVHIPLNVMSGYRQHEGQPPYLGRCWWNLYSSDCEKQVTIDEKQPGCCSPFLPPHELLFIFNRQYVFIGHPRCCQSGLNHIRRKVQDFSLVMALSAKLTATLFISSSQHSAHTRERCSYVPRLYFFSEFWHHSVKT